MCRSRQVCKVQMWNKMKSEKEGGYFKIVKIRMHWMRSKALYSMTCGAHISGRQWLVKTVASLSNCRVEWCTP